MALENIPTASLTFVYNKGFGTRHKLVCLFYTTISFVTDCKRDNSPCKFHQPLQLVTTTGTTIQLTITRGGVRKSGGD